LQEKLMPRGFTEPEKEKIRARLMDNGRRLFEIYGIRKTNVEELTEAAGISKGAFYSFYPSKEELFMDILEEIEEEVRGELMRNAFREGQTYKEGFKAFLKTALATVTDYPFFKNLTGSEYNYLVRKLPEERIKAHLLSDGAAVSQFLFTSGLGDVITVKDPILVANVLRSLFFVTMHKAEIGEDSYEETLDLLIEMVTDYLIQE
jgi:AcrR family transcriptional regulator